MTAHATNQKDTALQTEMLHPPGRIHRPGQKRPLPSAVHFVLGRFARRINDGGRLLKANGLGIGGVSVRF